MNFIEQAEDYIIEGYNPIPLLNNKAPKLPGGHKFLYQPIDQVENRFKNCDKIGIVCGDVSGGFYGLDFDKHKGENLVPIFNDFINNELVQYLISHKKLSVFKTPSGGYHFYFRIKLTIPGTTVSYWEDESTMIEIRGNGQYLCTYPSEGYVKLFGCDIVEVEYLEVDEYQAIRNYAESFSKAAIIEPNSDNTTPDGKRIWSGKWNDKTVDGKFNNGHGEDIAKDLLIIAGWQYVESRKSDNVELWTRPGKNAEDGISATWNAKPKMFYCFTDGATPFKQKTAYTPFNIYTLLKFNGDWKAAKDSLKPKEEFRDEEPDIVLEPNDFPIDVFPDFFRDYIMELKRTLNFHPDFSAAALMFAFATLNGNKFKLKVKNGWEASTIFWFACVGYPGTIKTHPVKTMIRPLSDIDRASKAEYDKEMRDYNVSPEGKIKPKFKQILISDYTLEALHNIHDYNRRGIGLYKDELKGFLNDMNKYRKGSDEEFWLESFNNNSYIVNRVTKEPIMINDININIIGTIQHDVLNKVITEFAGNGLIDRFLFTSAETKVFNLNDSEIDEQFNVVWNEFVGRMNRVYNYNPEIGEGTMVLTMDKETFAVYKQIDSEYCELQNSEDVSQDTKNYLSKMKTYVPRFALLMAIIDSVANEGFLEVEVKHMEKAKKIANYFINTSKIVFNNNSIQKDIKTVESNMRGLKQSERIIKLFESGFKQSEIAKYFGLSKPYISKIIKTAKG